MRHVYEPGYSTKVFVSRQTEKNCNSFKVYSTLFGCNNPNGAVILLPAGSSFSATGRPPTHMVPMLEWPPPLPVPSPLPWAPWVSHGSWLQPSCHCAACRGCVLCQLPQLASLSPVPASSSTGPLGVLPIGGPGVIVRQWVGEYPDFPRLLGNR